MKLFITAVYFIPYYLAWLCGFLFRPIAVGFFNGYDYTARVQKEETINYLEQILKQEEAGDAAKYQ